MKVGIIGAGAWGTALATAAGRGGNDVTLWSYDAQAGGAGAHDRTTPYLPGITLSDALVITPDMTDMAKTDVWLVVVPAAFFRETIRKARPFWQKQPIIICTKGMEASSHRFMSEIIAEEIIPITIADSVGVLSGPQFAGEVARGVPTGSTLAGNPHIFNICRAALPDLYLEKSDDIIGAQICAVGKNVVALLMGYRAGQDAGENDKAMTLTRAWGEIVAFGRKFGAKTETFLKLCGVGDLFLSATSKTSRNFYAGFAIATGASPGNKTVEGIFALGGLMTRAAEHDIRMPILTEFHKTIAKIG